MKKYIVSLLTVMLLALTPSYSVPVSVNKTESTDANYIFNVSSKIDGKCFWVYDWQNSINYGYINNVCADNDQFIYLQQNSAETVFANVPNLAATPTDSMQNFPVCDDFSSYSSVGTGYFPDGWYRTSTTIPTKYPYLYNGIYHEHSVNSIRFYASKYNANYAIMPYVENASLKTSYLSFWAYAANMAANVIEIGVMNSTTDTTTFAAVQTVTVSATATWQHFLIPFENYTGSGNYVTFKYVPNTVSQYYFYIDDVMLGGCGINDVNITSETTSAMVQWSAYGNPSVMLEYGKAGFVEGKGTKVMLNGGETSYQIKNLKCGTNYEVHVSVTSGACGCPINEKYAFTTQCCAIEVPLCENFDKLMDMPNCFVGNNFVSLENVYSHSPSKSISLNGYNAVLAFPEFSTPLNSLYFNFWAYTKITGGLVLEVGTMSDPNDADTFVPFKAILLSAINTWEQQSVSFATYAGSNKYIAIRHPSSAAFYVDDISISTCSSSVQITDIDNIGTTYATVHWTSTTPNVVVEYGRSGFECGSGTKVYLDGETSYTMTGLQNVFAYDVYVYANCGNGKEGCSNDGRRFSLLIPSCLDFTDLNSASVTCTYGTYDNPYQSVGVINHGSASQESRHTIHTDINEKDSRTDNMLSTVPPGGTASVRLGNWKTGAQAESVTYEYTVDASSNPIFLFQYAAVMQDPSHSSEQQPRLKLEILDSAGNLINPLCGSFDFISSSQLGWNVVGTGSSKRYWKDWTTMGIDLTPYDGQTVKIRMTNYDCAQGAHYGYAYFAFKCTEKKIDVSACGNATMTTLTAPDGFSYNWYTSKDPSTFSTEQSVDVLVDGKTYYCDLYYIGNTGCKFVMQVNADSRFPLAKFSYTEKSSGCADTVWFANNSGVSMDGVNLNVPFEKCDAAHWDFGNGQTSDDYTPLKPVVYTASGLYKIKLTVSLSNGTCVDSIEKEIEVVLTKNESKINASICKGTSFPFGGKQLTESGTYIDTVTLSSGCDSITILNLSVESIITPTFKQVGPYCTGSVIPELPTISDNNITGTWSPVINNTATTTYTFTPYAECAQQTTMTITINEKTTPTFNSVETSYCSGSAIKALPTISDNNISGTWTPALNNTATTTYTFTPNENECAVPTTLTITITPKTVPTFIDAFKNIDNSYCIGSVIPALPTVSDNGIHGTWQPAINNTTTTTYTFTPDAGECAEKVTATITIIPKTKPEFSNVVTSYCIGEEVASLPTISDNNISGTWQPAINSTATTKYTFTPNANQCADTATITIVINPKAKPAFNVGTEYCYGSNIPELPTTSDNNISGTWKPALNNTATTIYTFTPNEGECAESTTLTLTINPKIAPTFANIDTVYCSGFNIPALPTTSDNNISGTWKPALNNTATTTYTFTPNANECATTSTLTIHIEAKTAPTFANVAKSYCIGSTIPALPTISDNNISGTWQPAINNAQTTTYTFTPNANECATTTTLTITIIPKVAPTFANVVTEYCSGANIPTLPTTSNNGINGTWQPSINNTSTTTYTFTPNADECATTSTLTIKIVPRMKPTFANVATQYCADSEILALPTISDNGITGTWQPAINNKVTTTYTFTPNANQCADTSMLTINITPKTIPTFNIDSVYCLGEVVPTLPTVSNNGIAGTWQPSINQTETTTYTFTPANGQCAASIKKTIEIDQHRNPTISGETEFCEGKQTVLDAGRGYAHYLWNTGDTTQTIIVAAEGEYFVNVINANGCDGNDSIFVKENKNTYSSTKEESCNFYVWDVNGKIYTQSGIYVDTIANAAGCDSILTLNLTINYTHTTVFDTTINLGDYYDKNGFYESNEDEYSQYVVNEHGCTDTLILRLKVRPVVIVPNAMSPNDNSYNNITHRYRNQFGPIIGAGTTKSLDDDKYELKMIVFNRWNMVVFETNKPFGEVLDPAKHYWDGTYKGKILPEDAYLYYIKIKFKDDYPTYENKGIVSLLYK